ISTLPQLVWFRHRVRRLGDRSTAYSARLSDRVRRASCLRPSPRPRIEARRCPRGARCIKPQRARHPPNDNRFYLFVNMWNGRTLAPWTSKDLVRSCSHFVVTLSSDTPETAVDAAPG